MSKQSVRALLKMEREEQQSPLYEKLGLYYTLRSAMGINWANWFWLCGARGRGKSYAFWDTYLGYCKKYG